MTTRLMNSTAILKFIAPRVFDPGKGSWKTDANGNIVLKDGNPVYVDSTGAESTIATDTISRLNGEAKTHRIAKEAAEESLKKFAGIDPEKARSAIELIGKIDQKKLIDAGEVDKVRQEIGAQFQTQIAEKDKVIGTLSERTNGMMRSHAFQTSPFVRERIAVPPDMFERQFASNFKIEDEKLVPYYSDGNKVYSKTRHGEVANFEEALELIVGNYQHKESILKANTNSGSGNNGGGGGSGRGRIVRRNDFVKMSGTEQAALSQQALKGEVQILD